MYMLFLFCYLDKCEHMKHPYIYIYIYTMSYLLLKHITLHGFHCNTHTIDTRCPVAVMCLVLFCVRRGSVLRLNIIACIAQNRS